MKIENKEFDMAVKEGVVPSMDIDRAQEIISELKEYGWTKCECDTYHGLITFKHCSFGNTVSLSPLEDRVCFGNLYIKIYIPWHVVDLFGDLSEMVTSQEDVTTLYMLSKAEEPLNIVEGDQQMRLDYKETTE